MKLKGILVLVSLLATSIAFAQTGTLTGNLKDAKSGEPLIGVTIISEDGTGTTTDLDGNYSLELEEGSHVITIKYLGYREVKRKIDVRDGQSVSLSMGLQEGAEELDIVVVSGSKFERKLSEEITSVGVISSNLLQNTNSITLKDGVDKIAGVQIFDNQISIRGGSGYAFGVGSRVLLIIDDLPLLTVDRGEIQWGFIPLENTEQVEVLKSPSSALYGAAALNGVVHVKTGWPSEEPETDATIYYNAFAKPKVDSTAWWTESPYKPASYGATFLHKHRVKDFDFVIGANFNKTIGYIRKLDPRHTRLTFKYRHRPSKVKGFSYSIAANMMESDDQAYYFWNNAEKGLFIPAGANIDDFKDDGNLTVSKRRQVMLDARIKYNHNTYNSHELRYRFHRANVIFSSFPNPYAHLNILEYQYSRYFQTANARWSLITGARADLYALQDPRDLGIRNGVVGGPYAQGDVKWNNLLFQAGLRWEAFHIDSSRTDFIQRPLVLAGLSYQAGKSTYLRASFGEGYRVASLAELFVDNSISAGDISVRAFPNPDLLPEKGYNVEIGVKQGIPIPHFRPHIDLALFWQDYRDYIEFLFDAHPVGIGFKTVNIEHVRVAGFEAGVLADGKIGSIPIRWQGGYTYSFPVNIEENPSLDKPVEYLKLFFKSLNFNNEEARDNVMKYRSRHMFKSDIEVDIRQFTLGVDLKYYSFVENVDEAFTVIINGISTWREEHSEGDWILNLRASYDFKKFGKFTFIVNNATNNFYSIRPARMEAPMNFVAQYRVQIGKRKKATNVSEFRPD